MVAAPDAACHGGGTPVDQLAAPAVNAGSLSVCGNAGVCLRCRAGTGWYFDHLYAVSRAGCRTVTAGAVCGDDRVHEIRRADNGVDPHAGGITRSRYALSSMTARSGSARSGGHPYRYCLPTERALHGFCGRRADKDSGAPRPQLLRHRADSRDNHIGRTESGNSASTATMTAQSFSGGVVPATSGPLQSTAACYHD